uniref:Reverse transcriptase zinc-binding domain-containing protein n=1 Tax=Brassica oleracea var. oleracea TaxID=109376 RepID=A0A0D3D9Q5_BRAOL
MASWSKVVWFAQGVPRFVFITWLAFRDRLSTGTRMAQWGVVQSCLFCGEPNESRDHLFFACRYTFTVWLAVVGDLLLAEADPDWETSLAQLVELRYEKLDYILLRMVFQTAIYYIWKERNDRRHMGRPKTVENG